MIYKISCSMLFLCLIIAIVLALNGIEEVRLGADFNNFMNAVSLRFVNWQWRIPDIPNIEKSPNGDGWWQVLNVLIDFVNFLISVINFIIVILNAIKDVLVFITAIFGELFAFIGRLVENNTSNTSLVLPSIQFIN